MIFISTFRKYTIPIFLLPFFTWLPGQMLNPNCENCQIESWYARHIVRGLYRFQPTWKNSNEITIGQEIYAAAAINAIQRHSGVWCVSYSSKTWEVWQLLFAIQASFVSISLQILFFPFLTSLFFNSVRLFSFFNWFVRSVFFIIFMHLSDTVLFIFFYSKWKCIVICFILLP